MKCRFLLTVGVILWSTWSGFAIEKTTVSLDNLVKTFEQNPANPQTTMQLLKELSKQGKSGQDILNRYFKTQSEADYFKDYNWMIVRDYVNDINAPQLKYVFENQDKFIQHFSKDDVFQKLDNVLVNHLEQLYLQNKADYENQMKRIKETGYEHYDVFQYQRTTVIRKCRRLFLQSPEVISLFPGKPEDDQRNHCRSSGNHE